MVDEERLSEPKANVVRILLFALLVQAMVAVHAEHRPVNISNIYINGSIVNVY